MTDLLDDPAAEVRTVPALEGVKSEPLTYERHAPRSYFRDLILAETRGDNAARQNLERHAMEMRVNPDLVQGTGGYFAPPGWLISQFIMAHRPGRVAADLIEEAGNHFTIPAGVQSVNIPIIKVPGDPLDEEDPPLDPTPEADLADSFRTSPLSTFSGEVDVSLQALEQSPPSTAFDWAMFQDLTESYDADLNAAIFYGTGVGGQFLGLSTAAAASTTSNAISYTSGSPTFTGMYPVIGQVMAQAGDSRGRPTTAWSMRTARWAWIGSQFDDQHRPIVAPELAPPPDHDPEKPSAIGSLIGVPVYAEDSISATLGVGANQDQIFAWRPVDAMLFEGTPREVVLRDVLSGTLGVRIQLRNYAAFIIRNASSVFTLNGTGMVVQTGY